MNKFECVVPGFYRVWWFDETASPPRYSGDSCAHHRMYSDVEICVGKMNDKWLHVLNCGMLPVPLSTITNKIHSMIEMKYARETLPDSLSAIESATVKAIKSASEESLESDDETKYTKLYKGDLAFYIQTKFLGRVTQGLIQHPTSNRVLMLHSDFVVNCQTNEVLKCRQAFEEIFDSYTRINGAA